MLDIILSMLLIILIIGLLGMVISLLIYFWLGVILPEIDKRREKRLK